MGFILGSSKVAPKHAYTIPRLELCGAVLAVEISESIDTHLDFHIEDFTFYTDSKVVLCYIQNDTRKFYTYVLVANRVEGPELPSNLISGAMYRQIIIHQIRQHGK